jgi:hypothetical protein
MKTGWTWDRYVYAPEISGLLLSQRSGKFRTVKGGTVRKNSDCGPEISGLLYDSDEGLRLGSIDSAGSGLVLTKVPSPAHHPTTKPDEMIESAGPVNLDPEADHPTTCRKFYSLPGSRVLHYRNFRVGRPGVGGDRSTLGLFWGSS